ncbi:hypothetical protein CDO73_01510 [Saccharibacillus sp. O23]|uniref:hypothetical protein n=1 Tax=Saccharibacillus sp. O23 TaxID=2009338 RepID=UPI000B4DF0D1|nr:hypothetical protein [Saccharibacillus sp. O23]OWR32313.1 hypothetical protein CDO73_01510 [Saccharibacillus sp. O23]
MKPDMIRSVIGTKAVMTRVIGNSLIIYLDSMPGEQSGFSISLEPAWHLHDNKKVLIGSRQLQTEDEQKFNVLAQIIEVLSSKEVENIEVDEVTNDITVKIGEYMLHTFVTDANDEWIWRIRDRTRGIMLEASPQEIVKKKTWKKP